MPTNQSSPWGGGKLRACSSADSAPTAASVCTQDETSAASEVPFGRTPSELSWKEEQSSCQSSPAASSVASPTGSVQEKEGRNTTSIWDQFPAVLEGSVTLPQQQKWIHSPNQVTAPSELKRTGSSSSCSSCSSSSSSYKEELQGMDAMQKCAGIQTRENSSAVKIHQGSSGALILGLEPPSSAEHPDLLIRGHSPLKHSSRLTPKAADCSSPPPVPHVCLALHKHQGTTPGKKPSCHESTKKETRTTRRKTSVTRRSRSAKTALQRSRTPKVHATSRHFSGQLLARGVSAAVPDREPVIADVSSGQDAVLVGSVTTQISAIHLTKVDGQPSSTSSPSSSSSSSSLLTEECPVREAQLTGSECVMQVDGIEEDLPDELENACSDDDDSDGSSIIDTSSTASIPLVSSIEEPMVLGVEDDREERPALLPSLFPLVPPTLYFSTANEKVEMLPAEQRRLLKWKMSTVTPNIVKHTIARSHFKATKKSHDWLGCWGHHMKSPSFRSLAEHQKLNHFPGTFQIGRKDRLWRNLSKMQLRFGKQEFSFFPRTFILPQDIKLLRKAWEDGSSKQKWIIKPPASARGIGIQVIHKWSQIPRKRPLLVQKYLSKPYLISGNKFDLRIYVYVTSYDPLRIYIFSDGLVRFASCKYSSSMKTLGNKFMHLTNYSVNKKNSEYQTNSDDKACQGHKWALKALWQYLGSKGVNTTLLWEKIKDIVIKTVIGSEPYVNTLLKMHVKTPYSCHELFGFDIMLDENLKPWILEVNISPSLHSNSPLDVSIKGQMIRDLLNLAGFHIPQREELVSPCSSASSSTSSLCGGNRDKTHLSTDEKVKRAFYLTQRYADQDFLSSMLEVLTPEDVRVLAESEDELSRRGQFERVFPSPSSSRYLRFFECPRYLNILLDQWEQKNWSDRTKGIGLLSTLCLKGVHLGTSDPAHMWSKYSSRCELPRSGVTSPSRPSVVVTHQPRPHPSAADGSDMEAASPSPESSSSSSSPTQSFQDPQLAPSC